MKSLIITLFVIIGIIFIIGSSDISITVLDTVIFIVIIITILTNNDKMVNQYQILWLLTVVLGLEFKS